VSSLLDSILNPLFHLPALAVYSVVGALVFAEAAILVGIVFPGEAAVVVGGVICNPLASGRSDVDLYVLMVVVVVCAIGGDSTGYYVGSRFGDRLLSVRLLQRRRASLDAAIHFLQRRGAAAVFLGRFTAFMRAVIPGLAGISKMHYRRFLVANAAGGLLWGVGFCLLGYLVGKAYHTAEQYASWAGYGLLAIAAVALVVLHLRRRRRGEVEEEAFEETHPDGRIERLEPGDLDGSTAPAT
jgi:membrane protein DedA with SNARE-associated domain